MFKSQPSVQVRTDYFLTRTDGALIPKKDVAVLSLAHELAESLDEIIDRNAIVERFGHDGPWKRARALLTQIEESQHV